LKFSVTDKNAHLIQFIAVETVILGGE